MQKNKFPQLFTLLFSAAFALTAPFCVSADENITDVRMRHGDYTLGDLDGDGYIEDNYHDHDRDAVAELDGAVECALVVSPHTDETDNGDTTDDTPTTTGDIATDESPITSDRPITSDTAMTTTAPKTTTVQTTAPSTTADTADDIMDDDGGFNWLGLIIGLVIAAAIILLIILLIPKKGSDDKSSG